MLNFDQHSEVHNALHKLGVLCKTPSGVLLGVTITEDSLSHLANVVSRTDTAAESQVDWEAFRELTQKTVSSLSPEKFLIPGFERDFATFPWNDTIRQCRDLHWKIYVGKEEYYIPIYDSSFAKGDHIEYLLKEVARAGVNKSESDKRGPSPTPILIHKCSLHIKENTALVLHLLNKDRIVDVTLHHMKDPSQICQVTFKFGSTVVIFENVVASSEQFGNLFHTDLLYTELIEGNTE